MIKVQNALLSLWTTNQSIDDSVNLTQPLTYNDRVRFRKPRDKSFKLGPHWDSGSLNRWADTNYKVCLFFCIDINFKRIWKNTFVIKIISDPYMVISMTELTRTAKFDLIGRPCSCWIKRLLYN